jgi:hypothetical protein
MERHARNKRSTDPVLKFVGLLADTSPDFEHIYTRGACYHLHVILKHIWPAAELWYQPDPGHVWTKIGDVWYDIRGARRVKPRGSRLVRKPSTLGKPYAWKNKLVRRMDRATLAVMVAEEILEEKWK